MTLRKVLAAATLMTLGATSVRGEQNYGSASYMLPNCKSWLQVVSRDYAAVRNELSTGDARPGGIARHLTAAGMCAGMMVGVFEALRTFELICPPAGVNNEQLVRMAVNYVEQHPEGMHDDFIVPVSAELIGTWPCRK